MPICADSRKKSVTVATSFKKNYRKKKDVLIMPTLIYTYPENLAKMGLVDSEIINWSPRLPLQRK